MRDDSVVQGGNRRRVQVRAERADGFTERKRQIFLDHLAGCSNVTRAAAAAGVSTVTVNYHRRRDPAFGRACAEALETGYQGLEAMLIERAAGGGYEPGAEAEHAPGPESVDTALAQFLLGVRAREPGRRTGTRPPPRRATEKELNEAILAKLALLDARERKRKRGKAKGAGR